MGSAKNVKRAKRAIEAAVEEAREGIEAGHGGPFGAVVVNAATGKIVGRGHNRVLVSNDPTCHGEIEAIRDACRTLDAYDLSGHDIYTTGEPCPMCMGAILWANIDHVFFGFRTEDAARVGFRDGEFYDKIEAGGLTEENAELRELALEVLERYSEMDAPLY